MIVSHRIGILGKNLHGWQLLLEQEGVTYIVNPIDYSLHDLSAVIISDTADIHDVQFILNYLSGGGAILCSAKIYSQISGKRCKETFIRYLIEDSDSILAGIGMMDIGENASLPHGANTMRTNDGRYAVFVGELGGGHVVVLPFDAGELALNSRSMTKSFYSNHKRLPYELVSKISKGNLLKLFSRSLEILHHRRGLSYMHKWYYPKDAPSIFSLRIDTDYANPEELNKLYDLIREFGISATWFVDVKSQQEHLNVFKEMAGQEIGIHGYEHQTYDDYTANNQNIAKAIQIFRMNGLNAKCFSAPFGRWNSGIAKAIDESGFVYSSEFSYDYDNVPSYPFVDGKFLKTLQVPVYPISIGSLRRQGFDENAMIDYFLTVMEKKISYREPLFFYHHPKDKHNTVVEQIFDYVSRKEIQKISMIEYAYWWERRCELGIETTQEQDKLNIKISGSPVEVCMRITRPDGSEAFTPIQREINLSELHWKQNPSPVRPPVDIHRIHKFNPWILLQKFEDNTIGKIKRL
jgi:hypothetical protein